MTVLVEACVDSLEASRQATAGGAGRLELCANLGEGGTTASLDLLESVRANLAIPLHVLVRPRGGDFVWAEAELGVMLREIAAARRAGADGVVLGALDREGRVDREATRRLVDAARPLPITFHRAFDVAREPFEALTTLLDIGIERVLTSGQAATAEAGIPVLAKLVALAEGRIGVLAGGGIRAHNARRIVEETGVNELHSTGGSEGIAGIVKSVNREP